MKSPHNGLPLIRARGRCFSRAGRYKEPARTSTAGRNSMRSFQVCRCGEPLQMVERSTPQPTGTQVLLKVIAAGVCHSDIHIWDGYYELGGGKRSEERRVGK